jgi:hypothetical protein
MKEHQKHKLQQWSFQDVYTSEDLLLSGAAGSENFMPKLSMKL